MVDYMQRSVAQVCASAGIGPSGSDGTYTVRDFDRALDVIVARKAPRAGQVAAAEQAEVDEFAHLFPPTGSEPVEASADEDDDEFAAYFPPPGSPWA